MKEKKKVSIHFTIDKKINEEFDELVKKECLNKSLLIQTLIETHLKNKISVEDAINDRGETFNNTETMIKELKR